MTGRLNFKWYYAQSEKPCVYRYIDKADHVTKYVGIVYKKDRLAKRLADHYYNDDWCKGKQWQIEYFECDNRSEVEAFESHLIALYGTDKYFNKCKAGWGINKYLPEVEDRWKMATADNFEDYETFQASILFRKLLRLGGRELAEPFLELFEIGGA